MLFRVLLATFAVYCAAQDTSTFIGCVHDISADTNLYPTSSQLSGITTVHDGGSTTVQIAEDFNVTYYDTYKHLLNNRSGQEFILYQCGTAKPESAEYENMTFFEIPLQNVMTASTVPLHFVELLGVEQSFWTVDMTYVTSPCFQRRVEECETTQHIASSDAGWSSAVNDDRTDAVIIDYGTPSGKDISFSATSDPGILNRAEWIKYLSVFYNVEAEANKHFDAEVEQVNAYKAEAEANAPDTKPIVAFIQYSAPYYSEDYPEWNSDASWSFSIPEYKNEYVEFAGGRTVDLEAASYFTSAADFKEASKGIAIVIDETYPAWPLNFLTYNISHFMELFEFTEEDVASGDWPFLSGLVFRNDKTVNDGDQGSYGTAYGTAWFESGISQPAKVLRDMLYVTNKASFPQYSDTLYFRNIALEEPCVLYTKDDCPKACEELAAEYLS
eukprot:gene18058-21508_t